MRPEPKHQISEKALTVWAISASLSMLILWSLFATYLYLTIRFEWPMFIIWIVVPVLIFTTIISVGVMPKFRMKRWRYEVHEQEIDLQQGVWNVTRTIVPMVRVQHVDTEQGPLLRKYGLATVAISTAATVHQIPALPIEEADQLRDRISILARVVDEDV